MSTRDLFSNLMSQRIWSNWSVGCVSSLFLSGLLCIGCHPLTSPCCEPRAAQQRTDTLGVGRGPRHSYIEYQRYHFSGQIPTSSKIAAAAADKKNRLEVMSAFLRFFPFTLSLQSVCSWGVRKKLSSPFSPPSLPFVHQFLYRICHRGDDDVFVWYPKNLCGWADCEVTSQQIKSYFLFSFRSITLFIYIYLKQNDSKWKSIVTATTRLGIHISI